jgi:uncharacterized protein YodC (DUF2158 family)
LESGAYSSVSFNKESVMANKFVIGNIVKLKSGGPGMTVRTVPDMAKGYYDCQWFAGKKLESGRFPEDSLEPVEPDAS